MQQWLVILIGAAIQMVLGAFWYSPIGFGTIWMTGMGYTNKDMDKAKNRGMLKLYIAAFIGSILTSFVLARVILLINARSVGGGAATALLLWLGFAVPLLLSSVLWEQKPLKIYFINIAYQLVSMVVMGGVIGVLI
ncbi:MAG TPA: DUF1761 domain-containing protein [Candidatus Nanoarchaeia archaeon]|nr:DUF1761 domain-containing protein [Candidatus Nanoarchaeia archaeon]